MQAVWIYVWECLKGLVILSIFYGSKNSLKLTHIAIGITVLGWN